MSSFNLINAEIDYMSCDDKITSVIPMIKKFAKVGNQYDEDLLQELCLELLEDDTYDKNKGAYSTYAYWKAKSRRNDLVKEDDLEYDSLNQQLDNGIELQDVIESEEKVNQTTEDIKSYLYKKINQLSDKHREIVLQYFYKDKTLQEISKDMDCSFQYIGVELKKALKRLRLYMEWEGDNFEEMINNLNF